MPGVKAVMATRAAASSARVPARTASPLVARLEAIGNAVKAAMLRSAELVAALLLVLFSAALVLALLDGTAQLRHTQSTKHIRNSVIIA